MKKQRADILLAEQGLADSREKAKRLIMAGQVSFLQNGQQSPVAKPGQQFDPQTTFELKGVQRFVSRGGEKLLTALENFSIEVQAKTALDGGASTGGFTDCLLQHGAAKVYAVDVGYGQLHYKLRQDSRVINMERVNLRHAPDDLLPEKVDLIVIDCSFISLKLILPPCIRFLKPGGEVIALVKPQFELGAESNVKGVVRDEKLQMQAVQQVTSFAAEKCGLEPRGVVPAKIKGPKGNQEYLVYLHQPCKKDNK